MKGKLATVTICSLLFFWKAAFAHRIDEYLQATIFSLEENRIQASMRLIPGVLVAPAVIAGIDRNSDGVFSDEEKRAYSQHVLDDLVIKEDGKDVSPKLVSWSFPELAQMREGLAEIHIDYSVDVLHGGRKHSLVVDNHHLNRKSVYLMNALLPNSADIHLLAQKRNQLQSSYELDYEQTDAAQATMWEKARVWLDGVQTADLFRLGVRHIAEGTDHLLFLLALLLPAPLLVKGARWGAPIGARQSLFRILGIVTAFTIGHSITLSLAALGALTVPSHPVEVLIAFSILVSAVHAFRPIFPGKEALIAAFFGLIHGLAFAATLDRLGLGRWERVAGILSFNLGIETMQMLVVAAILPSLILMSSTRVYPVIRIGGAIFAGFASAGWAVERIFRIDFGVDTFVNSFAQHSALIAASLFLLSVTCRLAGSTNAQRTAERSSLHAQVNSV